MKQRVWTLGIPIALTVVAAVVRFHGIGWGLPDAGEEATPLRVAWEMWGFGGNERFDPNPHFFNYPSLIIYAQFLGQAALFLILKVPGIIESVLDFRILYVVDKTVFYLMGRGITASFGVGTVLVTWMLGRKIGGQWIAGPAAFLVAMNTLHIGKSQVVGVDVPLSFFVVCALWMCLRIVEKPTRASYMWAGVCIGLAASTKYPGALLVFPLAVAAWYARKGAGVRMVERHGWVVGFVFAAAVFVATSPFVILDFSSFMKDFALERQHMQEGHFGVGDGPAALYYLRTLAGGALGVPALVLALAGIAWFGWRRRMPMVIILTFIVPYVLAISSWSMKTDRYLLPLLPLLNIVALGFVMDVLTRSPRFAGARTLARAMLVAGVVLFVAAPVLRAYPRYASRLQVDTRVEARSWIEARIPGGSFIVTEAQGPELFGPADFWPLDVELRKRLLEERRSKPFYAIQPIAMFQTSPERSEVFYDLALYQDADVIITTGAVRSRYLLEPERFVAQIRFYDALEKTFQKIHQIDSKGKQGSTITIYRRPNSGSFGSRREPAGPKALREFAQTSAKSREQFYYTLGLNYETFEHFDEAAATYALAFDHPIVQKDFFRFLSVGLTRSLVSAGRYADAAVFLARAAPRAPGTELKRQLELMREQVLRNDDPSK